MMVFGGMILRYALGGAMFTAIVGGAYFYYNYSQDLIRQQAEMISSHESVIDRMEAQIQVLIEENDDLNENTNSLIVDLQAAETRTNELLLVLAEHDLYYLASVRPQLIENRINSATNEVIQSLEQLSR